MAKNLAAVRLRLLIRQLGEERGYDTGWKTAVASQLGIGGSLISKLDKDEARGVGQETIERVIAKMKLDPRFFYEGRVTDRPHYKDHVRDGARRGGNGSAAPPPHWADFLRLYDRIERLSAADLDRIRGFWSPELEITSWRDWAQLASWYLDRRPVK